MITDDVIERAGRTLAQAAGSPAKVILFGSRARGDARPASDLDFLVIEQDLTSRRDERVRLRMALEELGVPVNVIVVSERHVEEWGAVEGTMVHSALQGGQGPCRRVRAGSGVSRVAPGLSLHLPWKSDPVSRT